MENFTLVQSLIGGILLGLSAAGMLYFVGRILGISGICSGLITAKRGETLWRGVFIAGLMAGGMTTLLIKPELLHFEVERSTLAVIVAGLLVGVGVRLGNGCTSGHGICGIGRLSPRSIIAVATFMAAGAITVYFINHVLGGRI